MKRPAHKNAHAICPNGKTSWAACDLVTAHQWGLCKAVVGDKEPEPCSRWAVGDEGWCWQHYTSEVERIKREERIAIAKATLDAKIAEYMEWTKDHPSVWDERNKKAVKPKGPHRLTELA